MTPWTISLKTWPFCHSSSTIAIVAVDFRIFPRRFAKCETFGVSLMDAGVGCFMFSSGLVSRRAKLAGGLFDFRKSVITQLKRSSALLVIGIVKFVAHASVEYQVTCHSLDLSHSLFLVNPVLFVKNHVSEYGVHWNFFLTFAVVSMIGCVLPAPLLPRGFCGIQSFAVLEGIGAIVLAACMFLRV